MMELMLSPALYQIFLPKSPSPLHIWERMSQASAIMHFQAAAILQTLQFQIALQASVIMHFAIAVILQISQFQIVLLTLVVAHSVVVVVLRASQFQTVLQES